MVERWILGFCMNVLFALVCRNVRVFMRITLLRWCGVSLLPLVLLAYNCLLKALSFQFEGVFDARHLSREHLVCYQSFLHLCATVYHGGVVAVANELSDAAGRHLRVFLSQVHRHLTSQHIVALSALGVDLFGRYVVMAAHLIEYVVDGKRVVVDLNRSLDDALSQSHVYLAVVNNGVGHERVDDPLQVAHAAIGSFRDKLDDVARYAQSVASYLIFQDIDAKLRVRFLQFGDEATGETCEQTVGHALEVHRRSVACEDDTLSVSEKVVEYVEERFLRLCCAHPFLYVIYDEHVDGLVESDEVVYRVLQHRVCVLHLEETRADV